MLGIPNFMFTDTYKEIEGIPVEFPLIPFNSSQSPPSHRLLRRR